MNLKKKVIQLPFSKKKCFSIIFSDVNDLKNGVIKLCNYLKKGIYLVQVFPGDNLNNILNLYSNKMYYKKFNYYLIDSLEFIFSVRFEELRFLNIYSINKNNNLTDLEQINFAEENYNFQLGFDNYLEYVEIIINCDCYDQIMLKNINSFINETII